MIGQLPLSTRTEKWLLHLRLKFFLWARSPARPPLASPPSRFLFHPHWPFLCPLLVTKLLPTTGPLLMLSPLLGAVIQVWSMNVGGSKLLLVHNSLLKLFLPSDFASNSNYTTSGFLMTQFRCCPTHLARTSCTPVTRQPQCNRGGKKTKSFTIVGEIPARNATPPTAPKPRRRFLPRLAMLTSQPSGTTQAPPS